MSLIIEVFLYCFLNSGSLLRVVHILVEYKAGTVLHCYTRVEYKAGTVLYCYTSTYTSRVQGELIADRNTSALARHNVGDLHIYI